MCFNNTNSNNSMHILAVLVSRRPNSAEKHTPVSQKGSTHRELSRKLRSKGQNVWILFVRWPGGRAKSGHQAYRRARFQLERAGAGTVGAESERSERASTTSIGTSRLPPSAAPHLEATRSISGASEEKDQRQNESLIYEACPQLQSFRQSSWISSTQISFKPESLVKHR